MVEVPDRGQCTHITTISHNYSATFRYLLLRLTQSCYKMLLGRRIANDNHRSVKIAKIAAHNLFLLSDHLTLDI